MVSNHEQGRVKLKLFSKEQRAACFFAAPACDTLIAQPGFLLKEKTFNYLLQMREGGSGYAMMRGWQKIELLAVAASTNVFYAYAKRLTESNQFMKRFAVTFIFVAALAGVWTGGCGKKQISESNQAVSPKEQVTYMLPETAASESGNQSPKEVRSGTIQYLDDKNGFRDVSFGMDKTNFTNLVFKERDEVRQVEFYTRPGDVLLLEGVPLESIEYGFFKNRLFRVSLRWRVEITGQATQARIAVNGLPRRCSNLYGRPQKQSQRKDGTDLVWRGRKVEIILNEFRPPGAANLIKGGGWAIPPAIVGQMTFESLPFRAAVNTVAATETLQRQDGF